MEQKHFKKNPTTPIHRRGDCSLANARSGRIFRNANIPRHSIHSQLQTDGIFAFNQKLVNRLLKKLQTVYNRGLSSGFYLGMPTADDFTDAYGSKATKRKVYVGYVMHYYSKMRVAEVKIETNGLRVGDSMMIQGNTTGVYSQKIGSMEINHKKIKFAEKGKMIAVKVKGIVRKGDKVFVIVNC